MISASLKSSGKTEAFLKNAMNVDLMPLLNKAGKEGVAALRAATPVEDGTTAAAWTYEIVKESGKISIIWNNTNVVNGRPIAILLQYGHATRNGGYVQGRDYINPALRPIFDKLANDAWKVVTRV